MIYDLPREVCVGGVRYPVRTDYRDILTILFALSDPALREYERLHVLLTVFYPETTPPDTDAAVRECFRFLSYGEEDTGAKRPKLMDWEQDFRLIAAPISRALGQDVRSIPYLHWWSFLDLYGEIGDCTFAQVVAVRRKRARGEKLTKQEREFYRENPGLVDIRQTFSGEEDALLKQWLG